MLRRLARLFPLAAIVTAIGWVAGPMIAAQQPPPIGVAPVAIGPGPYLFDTAEQHQLRVVVVARGLSHPFSLALLPNGDALVTERGKTLRLVRQATGPKAVLDAAPVSGLPAPPAIRGGGVQDVVLHPKFATNGLVYVSYNKAGAGDAAGKSAVALGRGRLEGTAITGFVGDLCRRVQGRQQRLAPGLCGRRLALPDDRRRQRRLRAGAVERLRQGAAPEGRRHRAARQSVSGPARRAARRSSRWGTAISWAWPCTTPPARCSPPTTAPTAATR